jgi:hypothetical protein
MEAACSSLILVNKYHSIWCNSAVNNMKELVIHILTYVSQLCFMTHQSLELNVASAGKHLKYICQILADTTYKYVDLCCFYT